jgi:hypothetical protein
MHGMGACMSAIDSIVVFIFDLHDIVASIDWAGRPLNEDLVRVTWKAKVVLMGVRTRCVTMSSAYAKRDE